jgi:hypothetical protein
VSKPRRTKELLAPRGRVTFSITAGTFCVSNLRCGRVDGQRQAARLLDGTCLASPQARGEAFDLTIRGGGLTRPGAVLSLTRADVHE